VIVSDLEWLTKIDDPQERGQRIREAFAKVAATDEGLVVFHVLLADLYYYEETATPEEVALSNCAKRMVADYFDVKSDVITQIMLRS